MKLLPKIMFFCLLASSTLYGQDYSKLQAAFSKSYGYEAQAKYESAIAELKAVYDEKSYETNYRIGWLNYMLGKYDESATYYQKAAKLMPVAVEPLWAMITPLSAQEKWTEVENAYLSILKIDAKNSKANYNLGLIYYYRKDYNSAKKYFDVALNLYPFDYDSMLMSAWTNYFLGKTSEAKILFNKVLLYSPGNTSALEGLGLIK